jgi:hypothetical protein
MMNVKITSLRIGIAAMLSAIMATTTIAQPSDEETPAADTAEEVTTRLARVYLDLARIELQLALEANELLEGTYSAPAVQRLRNNVTYAETLLQEQLGEVPEHESQLRDLEGSVQLAEARLKSALSVRERLPESIRDTEIQRLRLLVDVARLALERARQMDESSSPHDRLRWRMEQFRYEIRRLQVDLDLLRPRP